MIDKQYVVFKLGREEYGIDIAFVNEISEFKESNQIPNTPYFIDGVINLRGEIVPIINLKKKFNITDDEISQSKRILVVNIIDKKVGLIVDQASEVSSIKEENLELPPDIICGEDRKYISKIGKLENRIIIILDSEKILKKDETSQLIEVVSNS